MSSRSLARELALLVLGQLSDQKSSAKIDLAMEAVLDQAMASLMQHWRETLDSSASDLEQAQQSLLDSELQQGEVQTVGKVRDHPQASLSTAEQVLNGLSACMELPVFCFSGIRNTSAVVRWSGSPCPEATRKHRPATRRRDGRLASQSSPQTRSGHFSPGGSGPP